MSKDVRTINLTIALAPRQLGEQKDEIKQKLEEMKLNYVPEIGGVLLNWSNLNILSNKGFIIDDQPFVFWNVSFEGHVFELEEGKIVKGKIEKVDDTYFLAKSYDSFTVTVSIPDEHINDSICKGLAIEDDVFFRMSNVTEGAYRGILDSECLYMTEENLKKTRPEENLFDFAQALEY